MFHFAIEVVSDTVCPWCYVGQRHLTTAISTFQSAHPSIPYHFYISWKPYYLNPSAAGYPGISKEAAYAAKFPPQLLTQIRARLNAAGQDCGINFKHGGQTGKTRDSHRLIHLVGEKFGPQAQNKVVERVFKGYFEEEGNPTDVALLAKWAAESGVEGLKEGMVKQWLGVEGEGGEAEIKLRQEGEEAGRIVDREARWASDGGINGVPNFKINDRYELGGAQPVEEFVKLFERIVGENERAAQRANEILAARAEERAKESAKESAKEKGEKVQGEDTLAGQACEVGGKC